MFAVVLAGCVFPASRSPQPAAPTPAPVLFPPRDAMDTGDYVGFYLQNSEALKTCQDPDKCAEALFNLVFLRCYPKSPYYDPRLGLKYIDDLIAAVPGSAWAGQAVVWKDLIEKSMKKNGRKSQVAREDSKLKEGEGAPEATGDSARADDFSKPDDASQEKDWEVDRQRMEEEITSKDEIINKLKRQLERSRQIDIEMEQKERGLLP
jgi:hypothetical protein